MYISQEKKSESAVFKANWSNKDTKKNRLKVIFSQNATTKKKVYFSQKKEI